jgi:hypothetical protein
MNMYLRYCPVCAGRLSYEKALMIGDTITYTCEGHERVTMQLVTAPRERPPSLSSVWRCSGCQKTNWIDEYLCPSCDRPRPKMTNG